MESQYQTKFAETEIFQQVGAVEPPLEHIHSPIGSGEVIGKHSYTELFRALHFNSETITH